MESGNALNVGCSAGRADMCAAVVTSIDQFVISCSCVGGVYIP